MNNYIVKQANFTGVDLWWIFKIDGKTLSYKNGFNSTESALNFIEQYQPGSHVLVVR